MSHLDVGAGKCRAQPEQMNTAAAENLLVNTSDLQFNKDVSAAAPDSGVCLPPVNSPTSDQEDRPSCLSEQSKSDYRPPCTPRCLVPDHAALHNTSLPGTPMGDHFQGLFGEGDEAMFQSYLGPGSSGGSGRMSPYLGLAGAPWEAAHPATPPLALLAAPLADAPPRVTLHLGSFVGSTSLPKSAADNTAADKTAMAPSSDVPASGKARSLLLALPAQELAPLRAHSAAPWPAAPAPPLPAGPLADFDLPELGEVGALGGGAGGVQLGAARSLLGRPPSFDSDAPLYGLDMELEHMDEDPMTFASQPAPAEHRRLGQDFAGEGWDDVLGHGLQRWHGSGGARRQRTARRNSAPAPAALHAEHAAAGPAVGGSWSARQPMHAAPHRQREAGAAARSGEPQQPWRLGKPPVHRPRGRSCSTGPDSSEQGGTPKSATNADIPQRPRSQRQACRAGAKRTRHQAEEPTDSDIGSQQPSRHSEEPAAIKRRRNREAAQVSRNRKRSKLEELRASTARARAEAQEKRERLRFLLRTPCRMLGNLEVDEAQIRQLMSMLQVKAGHGRDVSRLQEELAMLHSIVPQLLQERAQARRRAAQGAAAAAAGAARSAFACAAEEAFGDDLPSWHRGHDDSQRLRGHSNASLAGSPSRSMPPLPPQDPMQRGGLAHSPARSDSFAHRGRAATGRPHGPGLPPLGHAHTAAPLLPMHGAYAPAPQAPRKTGSPLRSPVSAAGRASNIGLHGPLPPGGISPSRRDANGFALATSDAQGQSGRRRSGPMPHRNDLLAAEALYKSQGNFNAALALLTQWHSEPHVEGRRQQRADICGVGQ